MVKENYSLVKCYQNEQDSLGLGCVLVRQDWGPGQTRGRGWVSGQTDFWGLACMAAPGGRAHTIY